MKFTVEITKTSSGNLDVVTNVEGLRNELTKTEAKAIHDAVEFLVERLTSKSPLSL